MNNSIEKGSVKENKEQKTCEKIVTHNGIFHYDELEGISVLSEIFPDAEIVRTRDEEVLKTAKDDPKTIVVDAGREYSLAKESYDHHQSDFVKTRESSGIKYASAGLIWEHYGHEYLQKFFQKYNVPVEAKMLNEVWSYIDRKWLELIDARDNGEMTKVESTINGEQRLSGDYTPNGLIGLLRPVQGFDEMNPENIEGLFKKALELTKMLLERSVMYAKKAVEQIQEIEKTAQFAEDGKIMILSKPYLAWKEAIHLFPKVEYIVSNTGNKWSVMPATDGPESTRPRNGVGFPKKLSQNNQEGIPGINKEDILFFHNAGFLAMTKSQESAEKLAKYALSYYGNQLEIPFEGEAA